MSEYKIGDIIQTSPNHCLLYLGYSGYVWLTGPEGVPEILYGSGSPAPDGKVVMNINNIFKELEDRICGKIEEKEKVDIKQVLKEYIASLPLDEIDTLGAVNKRLVLLRIMKKHASS